MQQCYSCSDLDSRLTFARVIKKKNTEEYSSVPYIMALLNCFLYTWYGLPVVSYKWENFPVVTINGLGILLEISFILIYFYFASANGKASNFTQIISISHPVSTSNIFFFFLFFCTENVNLTLHAYLQKEFPFHEFNC